MLNADVVKLNKFLKNALELKFTDCKGNVVGSYEGVSKIKEYDKGYQEAMRFAVRQAGEYNPSEMAALIGKDTGGNQKTEEIKISRQVKLWSLQLIRRWTSHRIWELNSKQQSFGLSGRNEKQFFSAD